MSVRLNSKMYKYKRFACSFALHIVMQGHMVTVSFPNHLDINVHVDKLNGNSQLSCHVRPCY